MDINFESFIDWDNNPFILFSNEGKIIYLNNAAEILFGYVTKQELYDIALSYAPQTFGYKTTMLSLTYGSFMFHSITVGYENEDQLSLRLYSIPPVQSTTNLQTETLIETDINLLIEANIALFKTKNVNKLRLLVDQDLPTFKIDQNSFSKLLRKMLDAFRSSDSIDISLKLLIGQHIMINDKKEALAQLAIEANGRYNDSDVEIQTLAKENQIKSIIQERCIKIEIPLIR